MTVRNQKTSYQQTAAPIRRFRLWQDENRDTNVKIELLPLIDVIFCILTFFIIAAVNFSRQQAISLDLPAAKTATPQVRELLIVSIDDTGQLYVEKQPVTRTLLSARLKDYNENQPNGRIVLYASKNSTYREVIEVLDMLREVGGDRVALATVPAKVESSDSIPEIPGVSNPYKIPEPPAPPK
ncbi:MAG: biopolymer transporter ExbD [Xenococcaceae cyanobacterium MO_188.B19]|nr:biopolymer transporter ExbD [Xenococcaceae cyanobacterium MO_188.B19]